MAWLSIPNTDLEYDTDIFDNLPESRKTFWNNSTSVINNGIRTAPDGTELYLRVRKAGTGEPIYYESELNKTALDSKTFDDDLIYFVTSDGDYFRTSNNKRFVVKE